MGTKPLAFFSHIITMRYVWTMVGLILLTEMVTAAPRLSSPGDREDRRLLGINETAETFALNDIEASALVLLVFDLYCPACQKSARNMKGLAESLGEILPAIPILGVGTGDTPFETRKFKEKFKLPFVCVSDREKMVAEHYQVERTPSVIVMVRAELGQAFTEIYRHEGYLGREHIAQVLLALEETK